MAGSGRSGLRLCQPSWCSCFAASSRNSIRYKHAQAEVEDLVKQEGARRPRTSIWSIPGAKKRIFIGWLLYIPNACGYWGITVFLTTFMVQKFHVTPTDAIFYAMMFYVVQFFLSYVGTGLSDWLGRRPAGIIGAVIMMVCTVIASRTEDFNTFLVFGAIMIGMLGWLWGIGDTYLSESPHNVALNWLRHHGRRRPRRFDLCALPCRLGNRRIRPEHSIHGNRVSVDRNHYRIFDAPRRPAKSSKKFSFSEGRGLCGLALRHVSGQRRQLRRPREAG